MQNPLTLVEFPGRDGLSLSPFCNKVRLAMAAKQLPFRAETWLSARKSPTGRLPILFDGGATIADSSEILRHLDSRFIEHPLIPPDPRRAAEAALWEEWADESLCPLLQFARVKEQRGIELFVQTLQEAVPNAPRWLVGALTARRQRKNRRTKFSYFIGLGPGVVEKQIERAFDTLEAFAPAEGWLLGDALSLADVSVAAPLTLLHGFDSPARAAFERRPRSSQWLGRVLSTLLPRMRELEKAPPRLAA